MRLPGRIVFAVAVAALAAANAATLQQLSLEELAQKSTAIAVGRAGSDRVIQDGPLLFTLYEFTVGESHKGRLAGSVEVALPGGSLGDLQQYFGGVPELEAGREYLLFLWHGPSGKIQITGLSQGVFEIVKGSQGERRAVRKPSADVTLIPGEDSGAENGVDLELTELVRVIRAALEASTEP